MCQLVTVETLLRGVKPERRVRTGESAGKGHGDASRWCSSVPAVGRERETAKRGTHRSERLHILPALWVPRLADSRSRPTAAVLLYPRENHLQSRRADRTMFKKKRPSFPCTRVMCQVQLARSEFRSFQAPREVNVHEHAQAARVFVARLLRVHGRARHRGGAARRPDP